MGGGAADSKKKRKHRGGKKRKNRRQSFAAPSEASTMPEGMPDDPMADIAEDDIDSTSRPRPFYRRRTGHLSDESLDSEALLDHRYAAKGIASNMS